VRTSIDHTLALIQDGRAEAAFAAARDGYLQHFENVEIPLRAIDNTLTIHAEAKFAEIRQEIRDHASTATVRTSLVQLRTLIDECERRLSTVGPAAATLVMTQSFIIIFREGFEVVLLVSILLGYLEAARSTQFIKPILLGIGLAAAATAVTVVAMQWLFAILPGSRPRGRRGRHRAGRRRRARVRVVLVVARLEHKRWMEFRQGSPVERGVAGVGGLAGPRRVHLGVPRGLRDGAFYQSLWSFGAGLGGYVLLGFLLGVAASSWCRGRSSDSVGGCRCARS